MPDVSTQTEKPKRKPRTKPKQIKIKLIRQKPHIEPLTPPNLIIMFDDIF